MPLLFLLLGVGTVVAVAAASKKSANGPPILAVIPDSTLPPPELFLDGVEAGVVASSATNAASQEALKRQNTAAKESYKGYAKSLGNYANAGEAASSWGGLLIDIALGIGKIIKVFSGDPAADASTDEQKARLRDDFAQILAMGFPPPAFNDIAYWGHSQLADETENQIRMLKGEPAIDNCYSLIIDGVDRARIMRELGRSVIYAAGTKQWGKTMTSTLLNNAKMWGGLLFNYMYPTYVRDAGGPDGGKPFFPRDPNKLLASELYAVYAATARYGIPEAEARRVAAAALSSFPKRFGFDPKTAGPIGVGTPLQCNLPAVMFSDEWQNLQNYAASKGYKDRAAWASNDYIPKGPV